MRRLRWALPGGLLLLEFLALSILVDLPTSGPAAALVAAVRLAVPVVLGAVGAGWLLARRGAASGAPAPVEALPPWRPWPALALHAASFGATAWLAWTLLGPGAPPPGSGALAILLASAGATGLLALAVAVPLPWALRRLEASWQVPLLSLLLGALTWRAAAAAEQAWGLLSGATLLGVAALLRAGPGEVLVDPVERVLGLGDFEVQIAPVCSGVDGVGLVVMFMATWLSLGQARLRLGRALLLLPAFAAAALAANVLRIAVLMWIGGAGGEALALGAFHSKLGWLLFLGLSLGGVALAERLPWLRRETPAAGPPALVPEAAGAYLGPLLATVAAALVTSLWIDGPLDRWYGARVIAGAAALLLVRRRLPAPRLGVAPVLVPALIGALTCLIWIPLVGAGDPAPLAGALAALQPPARAAWVVARLAGSILVIPLVEELAFRGFLLPWLVSQDFEAADPRAWTPAAVGLSSLAFGALHADWLAGALAGLIFAAAKLWRGRLADAVLAHAACNAGLAAAALLGGRIDLWS